MTSLDGLKSFLKKYDQVVESRKANSDICASEFQAIKLQSAEDKKELLALEGAKEVNKKKNRYKDILPYDHSRVVLQKDKFIEGSDYINANHVEDEYGKKAYIAAQGPMPHTVDDMWRMIWQFKIKMVIMGCKEIEMGKNRCHRYWAESEEEIWYHDIKVSLIDSKSYAHNMMLRELKAEKNGSSHILIQLHYMDWPDHGAPETTETILQLIHVLREKHPTDEPPILIHCSAGCGRTGAIIATDIGRKMIQAHEKDIDILSIVSRLRRQRPALVQSKEQYEFIYEVFREMVTREVRRYESQYNSDYMNINSFPMMTKPDPPVMFQKADPLIIHQKADPVIFQKADPPIIFQKADPVIFQKADPVIFQKADLPVICTQQPEHESKENTYINTQIQSDERRQIILPQEHAVNTDSGIIRRSRSAYGKKPKTIGTFVAPPEVPVKESKQLMRSMENLDEGPVLPPKSPKSQNRQKFFNSPTMVSSMSMKVKSNVPAVKPKLLKKPSLDVTLVPQNKPDPQYMQLETSSISTSPQEDFIPAPTPVGFNQYPMRSKVSHSMNHPILPIKPATKDIMAKASSTEKGRDSINSPHLRERVSAVSLPSNQESFPLNMHGETNKTFYSPNQVNQSDDVSSSKNIFGSASSSFDTSVVKNLDVQDTSNSRINDDYAVVDMSKKNNRVNKDKTDKLKDIHKELPKQTGMYESFSGDQVGNLPDNKFIGTYIQIDKLATNKVDSVQSSLKEAPLVIKPYTVTEVGFGYKKNTDFGHEPESGNHGSPTKFVSNKEMQQAPTDGSPLPIITGTLPPSASDDGLYAEINVVRHRPETDHQQVKLPTPTSVGINWFNDKLKNLAKRASNSSISTEGMWRQSFDINDKFGFPHRLNVKPAGPRDPPSSWKEIPAP